MKKPKFYTTYRAAVEWCNNNMIMCNNITDIDNSVYDNMEFEYYNEDGYPIDIFQWYITDCSEGDKDYLKEHFGLLFTYSDLLDKYILCVDHLGTRWSGVRCPVYEGEYGCPSIEDYETLVKRDGFAI